MIRSILVPLDGSPFGEHALPLALAIAAKAGAEVQVVHVHVPLAPQYAGHRPTFEDTLHFKGDRSGTRVGWEYH